MADREPTEYQKKRAEQRATVQQLKAAGFTQPRIAKRLGLSRDQVARLWETDGRRGRYCKPYERDEIERMARLGYGDEWIAEALNISKATVTRARNRIGIPAGTDYTHRRYFISQLFTLSLRAYGNPYLKARVSEEININTQISQGCKAITLEHARELYRQAREEE